MKQRDSDVNEPIAVIGVGAMFPARGTTAGFWRDIVEGVDAIRDVPESHWLIEDFYDPDPRAPDKTYSKRGAFIPPFPFEPMEFGLPPNTLEATDTAQLVALYVARQVLAEAMRGAPGRIDRSRIGVVLGVGVGSELLAEMTSRMNRPIWLKSLREEGIPEREANAICDRIASHFVPWQEATFPGLLGNVVAGRIANRLDLGGTNLTADAACASSLAALKYAAQELWLGEADLVLTGGADALNNTLMYMCFSKTPALSASGQCRPFSAEADGTILGEGTGILALRRLSDAERDGDPIYAVIRGIGSSSDGRANSVYAPRSEGQANAIRRAFAAAGYGPRTVELVEAHGTGTRAGDLAEFSGLRTSFSDGEARNWCALGSVKSQIGHTKSSAGAAGLIKAVLALHHKVLPPTINVDKPNPKLDVPHSPFYLNTTRRPWVRGQGHPRRAGVSSFGFGGTNFHIALEEYLGPAPRPARHRTLPAELFLVAAPNGASLVAALRAVAQAIASDDDIAHHAYQAQNSVDVGLPCRTSIVAGSRAELNSRIDVLEQAITRGMAIAGPDVAFSLAPSRPQPLALLCSGQGSQYLGMGADLAAEFDLCRAVWDEAADVPEFARRGLHDVAFPPRPFEASELAAQERELVATENAQPAIGAVTLAQLRLLRRLGLRIDAVAGHSFGELMALTAAGAIDERTALRLARARGEAMRDASVGAQGAMIAVRASAAAVAPALAVAQGQAVVANDNSAEQVILSGPEAAIARVAVWLSQAGIDHSRLPVSTAFHSPLVAAASRVFGRALDGARISAPLVPVYGNSDAARYPNMPDAIRTRLATQLAQPVLFRQMIERMHADGVRTFVEVGPGAVLTGLVTQILRSRPHLAVSLDHKRTQGAVQLLRTVGALFCAGHSLDLTALWDGIPPPALRPVPSRHSVAVSGANLGRRYPPKSVGPTAPRPEPVREVGSPTRVEAAAPAGAASTAPQPVSVAGPAFAPGPRSLDREPRLPMPPPAPQADTSSASRFHSPYTPDFEEHDMQDQAVLTIKSMHDAIAREHRLFLESFATSHMAFLRTSESMLNVVIPISGLSQGNETLINKAGNLTAGLIMSLEGPAVSADRSAAEVVPTRPVAGDRMMETTAVQAAASAPPAYQANFGDGYGSQAKSSQGDGFVTNSHAANGRGASGNGSSFGAPAVAPVMPLPAAAAFEAPTASAPPQMAVAPKPDIAPVVQVSAAASPAAAELVRAVVAEKTGYPPDMLDLGMDLESELGIDSIKQVEILSTLRERMPGMPEIDPARLAELRTIGAIAAAIDGGSALGK